jgi:hypothetical protein
MNIHGAVTEKSPFLQSEHFLISGSLISRFSL